MASSGSPAGVNLLSQPQRERGCSCKIHGTSRPQHAKGAAFFWMAAEALPAYAGSRSRWSSGYLCNLLSDKPPSRVHWAAFLVNSSEASSLASSVAALAGRFSVQYRAEVRLHPGSGCRFDCPAC